MDSTLSLSQSRIEFWNRFLKWNHLVLVRWVYCENLSSIGCLVAEKSLCGGWWVAQQIRIESLLLTLDFGLGLWLGLGLWQYHLNHILRIFNGDIMYFFLNSINHLTKPICFLNIFNIYSVVHFEMHQKESKESFLHNDKTYQRFFVPLQRNSISNTQHTTFRRFIIFSEIFSLFKIFHITFVLVC